MLGTGDDISLDTAVRKGQSHLVRDMVTKAHNNGDSSSTWRQSNEFFDIRYRGLDSRRSCQYPPRAGRGEVVLSQGMICAGLLLEWSGRLR